MSSPAGILLVDDHPLIRRGIKELLSDHRDFQLVGEAASGREAIRLAMQLQPDLVLLDLNMPGGLGGLQVLDELRQLALPLQVIILTAELNRKDFFAALQLGAAGYILKDVDPEELIALLRHCRGGELGLSSELSNLLADENPARAGESGELLSALTPREGQTLALIAKGMRNKEIARHIGISDGTVKVYVKSLLTKLQLHSRLELAVWVHRNAGLGRSDFQQSQHADRPRGTRS